MSVELAEFLEWLVAEWQRESDAQAAEEAAEQRWNDDNHGGVP